MIENKFNELGLSKNVLKAIAAMGFSNPSRIQEEAIPVLLTGVDVIGQAQTGTGKTLAFGSVLLSKLKAGNDILPQAIVLSPTRELAMQIHEELGRIGKFSDCRITCVYGGSEIERQIRNIKKGVDIIVGTPGRVMDLMRRNVLKLDNIKYVVLDEADEMLNMGFFETVEMILKMTPQTRQTLLFSATMPTRIKELANRYLINPSEIKIESESIATDLVEHALYSVRMQEKVRLLQDLLTVETPDRCIVFCSTREAVEALYQGLKAKGYPTNRLHGGMEQKDRLEVMRNFKMGQFAFLIATDVAARGIDISDLTHVFNFDLPDDQEAFVHRIGRVGRAGKVGKAITFVTPFETKLLDQIQKYIGFELPEMERPVATEVEKAKAAFLTKLKQRPKASLQKRADTNNEIMKIYLNGGKKKKLRAIDFVGTILSIEGIEKEDIGIIDIKDQVTYIDILNGKGWTVIDGLKTKTIKGKKIKAQKAYN